MQVEFKGLNFDKFVSALAKLEVRFQSRFFLKRRRVNQFHKSSTFPEEVAIFHYRGSIRQRFQETANRNPT